MTVIAWDGFVLAADTMLTTEDMVCGYEPKIHRVSAGFVAGSGRADDIAAFMRWAERGFEDDEKPSLSDDDFTGILVTSGDVIEYYDKLNPYKLPPGRYAWGAGGTMAYSFMLTGMSAIEAVEKTIEYHTQCGGEVTYVDGFEI